MSTFIIRFFLKFESHIYQKHMSRRCSIATFTSTNNISRLMVGLCSQVSAQLVSMVVGNKCLFLCSHMFSRICETTSPLSCEHILFIRFILCSFYVVNLLSYKLCFLISLCQKPLLLLSLDHLRLCLFIFFSTYTAV